MRLDPLEKDIQGAIIQAFAMVHRIQLDPIDAGGAKFRSNGAGGCSGIPRGFPDLLGAFPPHGTLLSIEVKRPGFRPSKDQADFLARRIKEGGIAFWADSVESALDQFASQLSAKFERETR